MNSAMLLIFATLMPLALTRLEVISVYVRVDIRRTGERVKVKCPIKILGNILKA